VGVSKQCFYTILAFFYPDICLLVTRETIVINTDEVFQTINRQ